MLAFHFDQRSILLAPYGCPLIMLLFSISGWHAEYVYLESVRSCGFHMPPIYMMCKGDYGKPEAWTSFSAFRRPSIKPGDIFIFIVSSDETLRSWWVTNTYLFEGFVYHRQTRKSNPIETFFKKHEWMMHIMGSLGLEMLKEHLFYVVYIRFEVVWAVLWNLIVASLPGNVCDHAL